jgi:predicted ATP-dependent endonuclease of OLD family
MNFGCFRDSGEVPINDVTALIAENENGKTTFLRALAWWDDETKFDEEDRWEGAEAGATLDVVALTFDVNDAAGALREAGVLKVPKQVRVISDTATEYASRAAVWRGSA